MRKLYILFIIAFWTFLSTTAEAKNVQIRLTGTIHENVEMTVGTNGRKEVICELPYIFEVPKELLPIRLKFRSDNYVLYNIYHPCATESLRFSFSRFFCAMAILLCSRAFSSSPTLASSNGFLVTTMV